MHPRQNGNSQPILKEHSCDFLQYFGDRYQAIEVLHHPLLKALEIRMLHPDRPSFTIQLLEELIQVFNRIRSAHYQKSSQDPDPIRYIISSSGLDQIFNWGGDLSLFVELIKQKDRDQLRYYAELCIDGQYFTYQSYGLPVINIAFVEGGALGGGFEYALTHDLIIAGDQAKFGLPEAKFNLFPGMGAYSILSRKIPDRVMRRILTSGDLIGAEEAFTKGLIDEVFSSGDGWTCLQNWITAHDHSYRQLAAHFQTLRSIYQISKENMMTIAYQWVDWALHLSKDDLQKMLALSAAQNRKVRAIRDHNHSSSHYILPATQKEAQRLRDQASVFKTLTEKQLDCTGLGLGMSCLDVGCGAGDVMELMGKRVGETGKVVGLDINADLGSSVVRKLNRDDLNIYHFVHDDITNPLKLAGETYDLVFARFLLLHMSDPVNVLKRLFELVKPGGHLVVMDYDFRTMDSYPKNTSISDLTRIIREVFLNVGLDPERGFKLPQYFEDSKIGRPDVVDVYESIKPVDEVLHVLKATYEGFLPMAEKLKIVDAEKGDSWTDSLFESDEIYKTYFMLPLVVTAIKNK